MMSEKYKLYAIRNSAGHWWCWQINGFVEDKKKATGLVGDDELDKFTKEPIEAHEIKGCEVIHVGYYNDKSGQTKLFECDYPVVKTIPGEQRVSNQEVPEKCPVCEAFKTYLKLDYEVLCFKCANQTIADLKGVLANKNELCDDHRQITGSFKAENEHLRAERDELIEALTPSAETKAAYMGEVKTGCPEGVDDVFVSWQATKKIIGMILERARAQPTDSISSGQNEVGDEPQDPIQELIIWVIDGYLLESTTEERITAGLFQKAEEAQDEYKALKHLIKKNALEQEEALSERDAANEAAYDLAVAVGDYFGEDVGEHSNANSPIHNAFELLRVKKPDDSGQAGESEDENG